MNDLTQIQIITVVLIPIIGLLALFVNEVGFSTYSKRRFTSSMISALSGSIAIGFYKESIILSIIALIVFGILGYFAKEVFKSLMAIADIFG